MEAIAATDLVAQQLRVNQGFPLLMLSRLIISRDTEKPVVFFQDFLRSDYVRIHTDINIDEVTLHMRKDAPGKEVEEEGRMP